MSDMMKIYDTVIIGGGPAGYTAALYAVRSGLSTLVLEKFSPGGQMTQTAQIDNYPGFHEGIDGFTLGYQMQAGAHRFGAETEQTEVLSVDLTASPKRITTDAGEVYGKTVIIATGADHRHLGVAGESDLIGRGVGYCAACDGMLYRGKTVAVVGGGNTAAADALFLSRICAKVYLIHRRDSLRASRIYHEPLENTGNVQILWNATVETLHSEQKLTGVTLRQVKTGETVELPLDGLFISVGQAPNTKLFENQLALDKNGYIISGESTETNIPGVFAAGDVRTKALRQIITAASDGAVAAHMAEAYLSATEVPT